ncbi:magnesium-dependent phosphatase 1-like isoform X2 [Adelges cooleyi]|nr:magnesium-dependent phosphatase 1-like isoform X2 [Adelges cooleyi]
MKQIVPNLIVFDLDNTLWPFHTDQCQRPFQLHSPGIVMDFDGNKYELFPEVIELLRKLKNKNYILAVASRIEDIPTAYQLLIYFNILHFFTYIEVYPCKKTIHFQWLHLKSLLPYDQMIFYDDNIRNIQSVAKLGVRTYHVKNNKGISLRHLQNMGIKL